MVKFFACEKKNPSPQSSQRKSHNVRKETQRSVQLKAALTSAVARLTAEHVPSPRMNAELLLRFTLDCDRAYLYAHPERELTGDEQNRYDAALNERARGVPAQYITGHQEFWGMDLIVTPAVLIPRPETEHVIEAVLSLVGVKRNGRQEYLPYTAPARSTSAVRIIDVGTGSGCIALALANELPEAEIHATDISAAALEIARANAARHRLENRIQFHEADLLGEFQSELAIDTTAGKNVAGEGARPTQFDFVVSNPPYVRESEADEVQLEVRKFEPRSAVFAGPTGTEVISRLIPQAWEKLRPGGWLVMEISGTIATRVRHLLDGWDEIGIVLDLQSTPRVVRARKPTGSWSV
jgi:release factor glutamine methyltransferase